MSEEKCLFCKIASGKIPSKKVFEDDDIYVFMDINPVHYGHTLIIPKKHRVWFGDLTEKENSKIFAFAQKLSKSFRTNENLKKAFNVTGTNILMFNGEDAGQEVFHSHCHVIPRSKNDGLLKIAFDKSNQCPKFGTKECDNHMKCLETHSTLISSNL